MTYATQNLYIMPMETRKFDDGKVPLGKFVEDHSTAFDLLGLVRSYAVTKYLVGSGWRYVKDNSTRSVDSVYRHISTPFSPDDESGLPHLSHALNQLLICCEFDRDQQNITSGNDPIRELYAPEVFRDLPAKQEANKDHWIKNWEAEKNLILNQNKPILAHEALIDYRLSINEMATHYKILVDKEANSLNNLNYCLTRIFECYKGRKKLYQDTSISNDLTATFFAIHALELKYKGMSYKEFIQPK